MVKRPKIVPVLTIAQKMMEVALVEEIGTVDDAGDFEKEKSSSPLAEEFDRSNSIEIITVQGTSGTSSDAENGSSGSGVGGGAKKLEGKKRVVTKGFPFGRNPVSKPGIGRRVSSLTSTKVAGEMTLQGEYLLSFSASLFRYPCP